MLMKEMDNERAVSETLDQVKRRGTNYLLVIDGDTLNNCIFRKPQMEALFFKTVLKIPSVCVCRCSPTDKAYIVSCLSKYTKKRICAVGDGGNDVGMILKASIGIGLVGKEGN